MSIKTYQHNELTKIGICPNLMAKNIRKTDKPILVGGSEHFSSKYYI